MLTLPLFSTAQNQRGLNWTGTLLLVYCITGPGYSQTLQDKYYYAA